MRSESPPAVAAVPGPVPATTRRSGPGVRTGLAVALLIAGVLVLLCVLAALGERLAYRGRVLPGVEIAGLDAGGMPERRLAATLRGEARRLTTQPVRARAGGTMLSVNPSALGLELDPVPNVRAARRAGRQGGPLAVLAGTILRRVRPDRLDLVVGLDDDRLAGVLDGWVRLTGRGLVDGDLRFEGARVVPVWPRAGIGVQRVEAERRLRAHLAAGGRGVVRLPVGRTDPVIDRADVTRALRQARRILAAPITFTIPAEAPQRVRLEPEAIGGVLATRVRGSRLTVTADPARLRGMLAEPLAAAETPPVDATWEVDGTRARVVPARDGRLADLDAAAAAIARAERRIAVGMQPVPPARTTEWAERLNITELVSSYTTSHPCCQPRVRNIHLAADTINGTVVEPGAVFSLNQALGPRTTEKGYVPAPAITADLDYEDAVGGGVSQLSTTLFNAVFFGCYEDVTHTVHSLYISRYPMGREATLNYPSIDNKFRNDSGSGVLIRTSYTATSITVSLYGNREGRMCRAEGPNILETIPPSVTYVDDPTLPAGTERVVREGLTGYVVENFRVISRPGRPDVRQRFVARYAMRPTRIARGTGPPPPAPPAPPPPAPPAPPPEPPPVPPAAPTGSGR